MKVCIVRDYNIHAAPLEIAIKPMRRCARMGPGGGGSEYLSLQILGILRRCQIGFLANGSRSMDEAIVRDDHGKPVPNPEGEAVICHDLTMINDGVYVNPNWTIVWCFVPPFEV